MRKYRLVMLLQSDLEKAKKEKLLSEVKTWTGSPVKEDKTHDLGDKKLAYPIQKQQQASYYMMEFQAETLSTDFEKRIGMQDNVLRHLLVRDN